MANEFQENNASGLLSLKSVQVFNTGLFIGFLITLLYLFQIEFTPSNISIAEIIYLFAFGFSASFLYLMMLLFFGVVNFWWFYWLVKASKKSNSNIAPFINYILELKGVKFWIFFTFGVYVFFGLVIVVSDTPFSNKIFILQFSIASGFGLFFSGVFWHAVYLVKNSAKISWVFLFIGLFFPILVVLIHQGSSSQTGAHKFISAPFEWIGVRKENVRLLIADEMFIKSFSNCGTGKSSGKILEFDVKDGLKSNPKVLWQGIGSEVLISFKCNDNQYKIAIPKQSLRVIEKFKVIEQ